MPVVLRGSKPPPPTPSLLLLLLCYSMAACVAVLHPRCWTCLLSLSVSACVPIGVRGKGGERDAQKKRSDIDPGEQGVSECRRAEVLHGPTSSPLHPPPPSPRLPVSRSAPRCTTAPGPSGKDGKGWAAVRGDDPAVGRFSNARRHGAQRIKQHERHPSCAVGRVRVYARFGCVPRSRPISPAARWLDSTSATLRREARGSLPTISLGCTRASYIAPVREAVAVEERASTQRQRSSDHTNAHRHAH